MIPKAHHAWFEDLPPGLALAVTRCGQDLARAMKRLYSVERVAFFFTGIHVRHVHAHVVPMHHVHDVTSQVYLGDDPDAYVLPPKLEAEAGAATARDLAGALQD